MFLEAIGWHADDRLHIYLTNTLEEPIAREQSLPFAGFISDEANAAVSVKRDKPLLVILGNPPYPRDSANPSRDKNRKLTFIGKLIEDYKKVDGQPIGERNSRELQADYVKFIRWAQWRIDKNEEGVIGYIVNNSFLDGPIFRGMRQSLLTSFNAIYLLNLHGSIRRMEAVPEGAKNENVFDISQGVCILFCVRERDNPAPAKVYYADMWGAREEKYRNLSENDVHSTEWSELEPILPYYLFVPQVTDHSAEYETGWGITDIFQIGSVGIATGRDRFTIHRSAEEVRETVTDFVSLSVDEARKTYKLPRDSQDWKVHLAQSDLRNHLNIEQHITPIYYRPSDTRWTYYTGRSSGFHQRPRHNVMRHFCKENFAFCVCRIVTSPNWKHALVSDKITDKSYLSNRGSESSYVFPLYLYPDIEGLELSTERLPNFEPAFLTALSETLELPQTAPFDLPEGVSPEEILAYIYAVLYSPTYRERYYDFLKYDFPRIPLPQNIEQFRTLATLGQRLMDWHLLKDVQTPAVHRFEGEGDGVVEKVRYEEDGRVWINDTQYFTDVPADVWHYEIGAYQVCEKWLRHRREETLSQCRGASVSCNLGGCCGDASGYE